MSVGMLSSFSVVPGWESVGIAFLWDETKKIKESAFALTSFFYIVWRCKEIYCLVISGIIFLIYL